MPALYHLFVVASLLGPSLALKWSSLGDKEYTVVYDKMVWLEAQKYCEKLGGGLAHADTEERNTFLLSLTDKNTWLYLGASNAYDKKTWEWHNPLKPMTFKYWERGEPNNQTTENCLVYWNSGSEYKWGDFSCVNPLGFICQRDVQSSDDKKKSGNYGFRSFERSSQKCITLCL